MPWHTLLCGGGMFDHYGCPSLRSSRKQALSMPWHTLLCEGGMFDHYGCPI